MTPGCAGTSVPASGGAGPSEAVSQGGFVVAAGTVKKWFDQKGYGFISQEGGPDIFVHYADVQGQGYRSLEVGDKVQFEVVQASKGPKAQNVVRVT